MLQRLDELIDGDTTSVEIFEFFARRSSGGGGGLLREHSTYVPEGLRKYNGHYRTKAELFVGSITFTPFAGEYPVNC